MIEKSLSDKLLTQFLDNLKYRIIDSSPGRNDTRYSITIKESDLRQFLDENAEFALREAQSCLCGGKCHDTNH